MDNEKPAPFLHEHAEKSVNGHEEDESPQSLAIRRKVERRLVWKQDLTMLPLLAVCFFFSYVVRIGNLALSRGPHSDHLDRIVSLPNLPDSVLLGPSMTRRCVLSLIPCGEIGGQIGNARIMGLQEDLGLSADKYYNALLVFCECRIMVHAQTCYSTDLGLSHRIHAHRTSMLPGLNVFQTWSPIRPRDNHVRPPRYLYCCRPQLRLLNRHSIPPGIERSIRASWIHLSEFVVSSRRDCAPECSLLCVRTTCRCSQWSYCLWSSPQLGRRAGNCGLALVVHVSLRRT